MAECLIALGSNVGDRGATMRRAVGALGRAPRTHLVARSAWLETPAVGGPGGQGAFLNGVVRAATELTPQELLAELMRIEMELGRVRSQAWGPRTIDLDLLLYESADVDSAELHSHVLTLPHPRMHYRRFVLEPAAQVAPSMVHPQSGWTVERLLRQLDVGDAEIAIAAADAVLAQSLCAALQKKIPGTFLVRPWVGGAWDPGPRLLLAAGALPGMGAPQRRKILRLPAAGPVAWLSAGTADLLVKEAWDVLTSAWPAIAASA